MTPNSESLVLETLQQDIEKLFQAYINTTLILIGRPLEKKSDSFEIEFTAKFKLNGNEREVSWGGSI